MQPQILVVDFTANRNPVRWMRGTPEFTRWYDGSVVVFLYFGGIVMVVVYLATRPKVAAVLTTGSGLVEIIPPLQRVQLDYELLIYVGHGHLEGLSQRVNVDAAETREQKDVECAFISLPHNTLWSIGKHCTSNTVDDYRYRRPRLQDIIIGNGSIEGRMVSA